MERPIRVLFITVVIECQYLCDIFSWARTYKDIFSIKYATLIFKHYHWLPQN